MINEILFIIILLVAFLVTLISLKLGKEWLIALPAVFLIIANIFIAQFSSFFGITTSLAVPIYASIFLVINLIVEHYGKKEAYKAVWIAFLGQLSLVALSQLIIAGNALEGSQRLNEALTTIFSLTPRIVIASLIAYIASQHIDVSIYHKLKTKFKNKHIWLRNNVSVISAQLIDTIIFSLLAFIGILTNLLEFILVYFIIKAVIAALSTPIIYLSYKVLGKKIPAR